MICTTELKQCIQREMDISFWQAKHHFLILPKDEGVTGLDCLTDSHVPLLEHMHRRAEGLVKR